MSKHSNIFENDILVQDEVLLPLLLIDRTRSTAEKPHNIIWATDNYASFGKGYQEWDEISEEAVTGENGTVLRPRIKKNRAEQEYRSKNKGEVFTTAWVCNHQNNAIDAIWFGGHSPFNKEVPGGWVTNSKLISFPDAKGKTWKDYIKDTRLEVACGEAPYLASRYNVITGESIPVSERIGLLDRKLRVVSENVNSPKSWYHWALEAFKSIYGYEWQGDNLVLARETMIYTFRDYYETKFGTLPTKEQTLKIAEIVSWNLWQMDGTRAVIPGSCYNMQTKTYDIFGEPVIPYCRGCEMPDEKDAIRHHIGIYCKIMDWEKKRPFLFIEMLK